jgi:hypothetical protein
MFEKIDFTKCKLPPLDGIQQELFYDPDCGCARLQLFLLEADISISRYPDEEWTIYDANLCTKEMVEQAFLVTAHVEQFIREQTQILLGDKPTAPAPEGWSWALTPGNKWMLQSDVGGRCIFLPEDRSYRAAMQVCIDVFDQKHFPTKGRFRCKGSTRERTAFQMTQERCLNQSEWPSWLIEAWNADRGAAGSIYATGDGTDTLSVTFDCASGEILVEFGSWIIDCDPSLHLMSNTEFRHLYEPLGEENG